MPERIWIRPASMEYSTTPLSYDNDDVEYVRAQPSPSVEDVKVQLAQVANMIGGWKAGSIKWEAMMEFIAALITETSRSKR